MKPIIPDESTDETITFQAGPQEMFLSSQASIAIFGGGAGGGKSYALLLEVLRHYENPKFSAIIFRRNSTQIRNPGGLWHTSKEIYTSLEGIAKQAYLEWQFPSGAKLKMAHLENTDTVYSYQGAQIPLIMFDELTHFDESQFWYMLSRLRSTSGVPGYVRATTNPDIGWVRDLISWWLTSEGYPIPERSGVLRWFIRQNDTIVWSDSKEELIERYGIDQIPKSITFIPSLVRDNKILMEKDPTYLSNLMALARVDRMRLLEGNWNVRPAAGNFFRREWFPVVDQVPGGWIQAMRFWDRACLIADTKVITNRGEKEIKNIKIGDLVLTRKGFKKVSWSGISRTTQEIVSVVFSNGSVISGTSCHPTYTTNRGWIKLSELKGTDIVLWKKFLSTEKDMSSLIHENITSTIKNTFTIMNGTESDANISLDCSIGMYGNYLKGLFPLAILSTTRTEIELITTLKTLNVSRDNLTDKHIKVISQSELILKIENITKKHTQLFQREHKSLKNINVNAAKQYSTLKVLKRNIVACSVSSPKNMIARCVASFLKPEDLTRNIVVLHVPTEDVPVYDLTVEDAHEFFANGILVHNSTKPNETNKDPDWTRGLKMFKYPNGTYCVADLKSARDTPLQIEQLIKNVAGHDSYSVSIMSQQDPGSAGVSESEHFIRMLSGYDVRVQSLSKDKITRAKPVSAQCEGGNIRILRGPWNEEFFNELENFPEASHDDIVDVLSGAFNALAAGGLSTADAFWGR